jgi:hypothetical protein
VLGVPTKDMSTRPATLAAISIIKDVEFPIDNAKVGKVYRSTLIGQNREPYRIKITDITTSNPRSVYVIKKPLEEWIDPGQKFEIEFAYNVTGDPPGRVRIFLNLDKEVPV